MFQHLRRFGGRVLERWRRPKNELLEAKVQFLLDEVSELRSLVRYLTPQSEAYQRFVADTYASFDYQWKHLATGEHLLTDEVFRAEAVALVEQYTGLPRSWFAGRTVLDAGCGNGRWTWTLSSLGATVTAIDQAESCVEATRNNCREAAGVEVRRHSLLESLPAGSHYDLVWCYGVAHHTGDTRRAIQNVAAAVAPGGYLFLMVYGEPRSDQKDDYHEINQYVRLRRVLAPLSLPERVEYLKTIKPSDKIHGWFDATSPRINDLHRFEEIAEWLRLLGFQEICSTVPSRNLHIIARRKS